MHISQMVPGNAIFLKYIKGKNMPVSRGLTNAAVKRKIASPAKEVTNNKRQRKAFCNLTNYAASNRLKEKNEIVKPKRISDGTADENEESLYVSALENLPEDLSITSTSSTSSQSKKQVSGFSKPCTRLSAKLNAENKPLPASNCENQPPKQTARQTVKPKPVVVEKLAPKVTEKVAQKVITKPTTKIAHIKPAGRRAIKPLKVATDKNLENVKSLTRTLTKASTVLVEEKCENIVIKTESISTQDIKLDEKSTEELDIPVADFDKACEGDIHQVSEYAHDIFIYMKGREKLYRVKPYLQNHPTMTEKHRAQLIDILVQLQEHLELTHETLYLAVYLLDNYLSNTSPKTNLGSDNQNKLEVARLQVEELKRQSKHWRLFAIAAMLLACKYEERCAPHLDEFVYCVSGSVNGIIRNRLIRAESAVWRACKYEMGVPLSYRFLRRYARCVYTPMPTLTLARYILELSLMDYSVTVGSSLSESKVAAAALWLARRMHFAQQTETEEIWNPTLKYYSGYEEHSLIEVIYKLNDILHSQKEGTENEDDEDDLSTIKNKYSHRVFYKVAETPRIPNDQLINK